MIYLASPYSHPSESVRQSRFEAVARHTTKMMLRGELVISPIVYGHALASESPEHELDHIYWKGINGFLLQHSTEVRVLMLKDWRNSLGVQYEIDLARVLGLPVTYEDYLP